MADRSPLEASALSGSLVRDMDSATPLRGSVCRTCRTTVFPIAIVCPQCMSEELDVEDMPRDGTLYSFTTLHVGPKEWTKPYEVGYVDLANGVRVFSHLAGHPHRIGGPVSLSTARIGHDTAGAPIETFVFRPADVRTTRDAS